ncbi:MAG: glycosyltransferase family 2 protein [Bacteroidota bacterium]
MKISVLTTLYYSSDFIHEFYNRSLTIVKKLTLEYEFILVNDGSPDNSLEKAVRLSELDPNVVIIDLSRNFGHAEAIMTGLQYCKGDRVFLIDCDLEEEPELLEVFWGKMNDDISLDVVYGVQISRKGAWFERMSGFLFYKFIRTLTSVDYPSNTLTARLMSSRYVNAVIQFRERELEILGVFVMSGFKQLAVPAKKGFKGSTTYSFVYKLSVAIKTITSLSNRPLYLTFIIGILSFLFACINISIVLYQKFILQQYIEGWASTVASIWMVGGLILFVLGIFGVYLSKMFNEIKGRPLSVIRKIYNRNGQ